MYANTLILTSHKPHRGWLTPHSTVVWVIKYGASVCGTEVIPFTSKIPKGKLSFNHLRYRSFNGWNFIVTKAIWLSGSVFQRARLCGYWLLWMLAEMNGTAFTELLRSSLFFFSVICKVKIIVFWLPVCSCPVYIGPTYWEYRPVSSVFYQNLCYLTSHQL